jgi:thiamine-phosphate pyrophosphorylase
MGRKPLRQDTRVESLAERRGRLEGARLYFVTEPVEKRVLAEALAGGADLLQLRDKQASDDEILAAAPLFRALCNEAGALFIVNDRPDLALAADADGVHVGQEDMSPEEARRRSGGELLVGLSTHSPEQFDAGLASEADYLCAGPVHATPTKEGRPATGLGLIREAAQRGSGKPWFAIGGIDEGNVGELVEAGAERAVVVRAIRDAADPRAAAANLRAALAGEVRVGR